MNIRTAGLTDIDLLAAFYQGMLLEIPLERIPSLEELKIRIRTAMAQNHRAFLFEAKGSIVGYSMVNVSAAPPTIKHFHISRQYQRKGYGRLAFVELLKSTRCDAVEIEICNQNDEILSFWNLLGYTPRIVRNAHIGNDDSESLEN